MRKWNDCHSIYMEWVSFWCIYMVRVCTTYKVESRVPMFYKKLLLLLLFKKWEQSNILRNGFFRVPVYRACSRAVGLISDVTPGYVTSDRRFHSDPQNNNDHNNFFFTERFFRPRFLLKWSQRMLFMWTTGTSKHAGISIIIIILIIFGTDILTLHSYTSFGVSYTDAVW